MPHTLPALYLRVHARTHEVYALRVLQILALFNGEWIAVTVAVASVSMAFLDYFYIPSQLAATNKALEDCHNLLLYWDSLSLVQRKTRAVKSKVCSTVEGAVLGLCQARTGVSSALPTEGDDGGGEE